MDARKRELANKLHQDTLTELQIMYGYDSIPKSELLHALECQNLEASGEEDDDDL